jgi:type IV secretory pathway TrbF-like protein
METAAEAGGNTKRTRMRALITIKLLPADDSTIRKNPLGIYIDNCEMTEL